MFLLPPRITALLFLLWATSLIGCAHYGWAEPHPSAEASGVGDVAVTTVAVDAAHGVDVALLTRTLVAALRERGIDARWGATATDVPTIDCRVGLDDALGFGDHVRVEAIARCRWADRRVEGLAASDATVERSALSASLRPIHQATAARALRRAALPLATLLDAATSSVPAAASLEVP